MKTLPAPSYRGKVRDIFDLGDHFILVASDRISAFDVVFNEPIPDKGKILTSISTFWFTEHPRLSTIVPNHLLETEPSRFPSPFNEHAGELEGRAVLVKKAKRVDYECVVRGYISGSAWKEYKSKGTINNEKVVEGLLESDPFPEPIFTPATKAEAGHDENVPFSTMAEHVGKDLSERLRYLSLEIYKEAAAYVSERGLILADTKFEFGLDENGEIILIDEVLTPDSSRYWYKDRYERGQPQFALDKQYVRDYLETLDWNKQPPPPPLPEEMVRVTAERYKDAHRLITGREFK